eukprot:4271974-Prymnesium_polylepis.2
MVSRGVNMGSRGVTWRSPWRRRAPWPRGRLARAAAPASVEQGPRGREGGAAREQRRRGGGRTTEEAERR